MEIHEDSGIWRDKNGAFVLGYISRHFELNKETGQPEQVNDNIPVSGEVFGIPFAISDSMQSREQQIFQHKMQTLFSIYPKPPKPDKEHLRHPGDSNVQEDHIRFYLATDKKRCCPIYECKGIRHDFPLWGTTGHKRVCKTTCLQDGELRTACFFWVRRNRITSRRT